MAPTKIRCLVVHPGPNSFQHCAIQFHKDYNVPQRYVQSMTTLHDALKEAEKEKEFFDLIFLMDRIPFTHRNESKLCDPLQTIRMISISIKRSGAPSILVFHYPEWEWVERGIADMHERGIPWVYIHPDDTNNHEWWFSDFHGYNLEEEEKELQDAAAKLRLYNKLQLRVGEEVASETDTGWFIAKDGVNCRYIPKHTLEVN